jgi:transcriptional regulator with XRE-family HTH domain
VGIHLSQLGRIERGVSAPSAETVVALARALHATTDALLCGGWPPKMLSPALQEGEAFANCQTLLHTPGGR